MSEINSYIDAINKKYKKKIIRSGSELEAPEMIPFTSAKMNYLTRGGIPENKMSEFAGKESSGKTTSALDIIANFQKKYPDRMTVYLDAENTLDKSWGTRLGVDWERVILIQPQEEYGEMLLDMIIDLVKMGGVGLVIVDSVPFIVPKSAWEGSMESKSYCGNSGIMTDWCRKMIPLMNMYKCTVVVINQLRDKIGVQYTAFNLPGGRMLYHAQSMIMMFSKGSLLDENGKEVTNGYETPNGHVVQVKVEKNKVTQNDRRLGSYTLNYYTGVDALTDLIDVAILVGDIRQGGAWYYLMVDEEEVKFQGKAKLVDYLTENETIYENLGSEVLQKIR